jgi:hypothetical protein
VYINFNGRGNELNNTIPEEDCCEHDDNTSGPIKLS